MEKEQFGTSELIISSSFAYSSHSNGLEWNCNSNPLQKEIKVDWHRSLHFQSVRLWLNTFGFKLHVSYDGIIKSWLGHRAVRFVL